MLGPTSFALGSPWTFLLLLGPVLDLSYRRGSDIDMCGLVVPTISHHGGVAPKR